MGILSSVITLCKETLASNLWVSERMPPHCWEVERARDLMYIRKVKPNLCDLPPAFPGLKHEALGPSKDSYSKGLSVS